MSNGESENQEFVACCVLNCQEKVPIEKAIKIKDKYFCKICGVAYYRSSLNI
ncbi:MAG: hypothetical protein ACFFD7_05590 [Candidatus Thorarchaeota archaeon]